MFGTKSLIAQYEARITSLVHSHGALVLELRDQYEARIQELKDQITDLKKLVFSQTSATPTLVALEADAILAQRDEIIDMAEEDYYEVEHEADKILSGNY